MMKKIDIINNKIEKEFLYNHEYFVEIKITKFYSISICNKLNIFITATENFCIKDIIISKI